MKSYSFKILEPLAIFLCGGGVAVAILIFYFSSNSLMQACVQEINDSTNDVPQIEHKFNISQEDINPTKQTDIDQELLELLKRATTDDKMVLMTEINAAWSEPNSLLDTFLESFHVGYQIEHLLNHMIIVATDDKSFEKCKSVHPYCYRYKVDGVNFTSEKRFKTKDYLKMMWTRNKLQRTVLEMGYNFLFTDTDIMWFRNPLQHISVMAQITISSDWYQGDPDDLLSNAANGGFIYVKSTNRTIAFYKDWYEARLKNTSLHEQEIFELVKAELSAKHQVKIRFIDTSYVGGICQRKIDFTKLCTFHATCVVGLESKLYESRKMLDQWKTFKEKHWELNN
ncbi:hypothetical protein LUZ60_002397 [Juncus effusus]|nr:hypothetical protein LUZ60_002397 [Juncus effusus]